VDHTGTAPGTEPGTAVAMVTAMALGTAQGMDITSTGQERARAQRQEEKPDV
jgi:hypothetical protein